MTYVGQMGPPGSGLGRAGPGPQAGHADQSGLIQLVSC